MTDFRELCARMADELDHYRQLLMDDRRETHALATEARAALAQTELLSLKGRIAAKIENGTACDRESERIAHDVIHELAAWIDGLGYHSCATELLGEINQ